MAAERDGLYRYVTPDGAVQAMLRQRHGEPMVLVARGDSRSHSQVRVTNPDLYTNLKRKPKGKKR